MRLALKNLTGGQHPGLLLQRYLAEQDKPEERLALLEATMNAAKSESLRALYSAAFARWSKSFPSDVVHASKRFATPPLESRLLVGLGGESVLETGLRLHHTYGVPMIPGSALKGLASHFCSEVWGESEEKFRRAGAWHSLLFGTTDDGGTITFHDSLITPQSLSGEGALRLDVMTPHHQQWREADSPPPTDFDSPIPISFLSVAGTFEIRLSWAGPAETPRDRAQKWVSLTMKLLGDALSEWGIGGKTSSGYGRLVVPTPAPPPAVGFIVEARLLEQRSKSGGWRALHEPSDLSGPIVNHADVPADQKADDVLKLKVRSANKRELAFDYPKTDEKPPAPPSGKGGKR